MSCYPAGCDTPPPITTTATAHVPSPSHPATSGMPVTGGDVGGLVAWGLGLALVGAAVTRRTRRRRAAEQGAGGLYR